MENLEEKKEITEKYTNMAVVDALKKDVKNRFEERQEKIYELEKLLNKALFSLKTSQLQPESERVLDFNTHENGIKEAQERNIKLARRIQFLSLQQQQANNLSIQRAFSAVQNELFEFENEFDSSLKNTCLLAQRIQERNKEMEKLVDKLEGVKSTLDETSDEISRLRDSNFMNKKNIRVSTDFLDTLMQQGSHKVEKELKDIEEKINAEMDECFKQSVAKIGELENTHENEERNIEELQISFANLIAEIEVNFEKHARKVESEIADAETSYLQEASEVVNNLEDEIGQIYDQRVPTTILEDELEYCELEQVIDRLNNLEKQIEEYKNSKEEKKDYKIYTGIDNGVEKKIKCYDDGTFEEV